MKTKNILICVSGLTPQIVTETFYCLTIQKKIKIDEIYIITTQRGRDVIFGIDEAPFTPKTSLKKELQNLCTKYKVKMPAFENNDTHIITAKEESLELSDIRTDKHNILFPNKVCEFISKLSSDPNNVLYCSISGGRKTMSVFLSFALSLFGREKDKLLHVLTSDENEFKGFYPLNKKEDKALEISEIPFVRLRSLIGDEVAKDHFIKKKYDEIVTYTQDQLKIVSHPGKMILRVETREIQFGDTRFPMEPLLFSYYYKFLDLKLAGHVSSSNSFLSSVDFSNPIKEFMAEHYNCWFDDKKKGWWNQGFSNDAVLQKHSKINGIISELIEDPVISEQFKITSKGVKGFTHYYIKANKNKFKIIE